jgi:hypothetical protein
MADCFRALIAIAIARITLYAHLEKDILIFLVCFRVYLFCKFDYGLEMNICLLVLNPNGQIILDQRITGAVDNGDGLHTLGARAEEEFSAMKGWVERDRCRNQKPKACDP